jgi:hypothetical protein
MAWYGTLLRVHLSTAGARLLGCRQQVTSRPAEVSLTVADANRPLAERSVGRITEVGPVKQSTARTLVP